MFNAPFSGATQVSRYQKGKTNLDFTEARDSEWQSHQLGHMQVCTSLQTDNHGSTPPISFLLAWLDAFLLPIQQLQSTEGISTEIIVFLKLCMFILHKLIPFFKSECFENVSRMSVFFFRSVNLLTTRYFKITID